MKTKIVTGITDVGFDVRNLSTQQYEDLLQQMLDAVGAENVRVRRGKLEDCWVYKEFVDPPNTRWGDPPLLPAVETASDRYANRIQHAKLSMIFLDWPSWAVEASQAEPDVDVWIYHTASVMKQGDWTGKRIQAHHMKAFFDRVAAHGEFDYIPFPGPDPNPTPPFDPHQHNWRFCGSTQIWPKKYLLNIERAFKFQVRKFITAFNCIPSDLTIWPLVEQQSGLPFRYYQGEYDATQLTNFPL